jgi:hypothetical protein
MSLWEFNAATGGYAKANRSEEEPALSGDEVSRLADWVDEPAVWH